MDDASAISIVLRALFSQSQYYFVIPFWLSLLATGYFGYQSYKTAHEYENEAAIERNLKAQQAKRAQEERESENKRIFSNAHSDDKKEKDGIQTIVYTSEYSISDDGKMSIRARFGTHEAFGFKPPTHKLSESETIVLRREPRGTIVEHDVFSVKPEPSSPKSALIVVVVQHDQLFHGTVQSFQTWLERIVEGFKTLRGADVSLAVYAIEGDQVGRQHFVKKDNKVFFEISDIQGSPLSNIKFLAAEHEGSPHGVYFDKIDEHFDYILKRARYGKKFDEKYGIIFLERDQGDVWAGIDESLDNVAVFFPEVSSEGEPHSFEQRQKGLVRERDWVTAFLRLANNESRNLLKGWALKYVGDFSESYRIEWDASGIDKTVAWDFAISLSFLSFEERLHKDIPIRYEPESQ